MIRFNNDYNHGCIPAILDAMQKANGEGFDGYGNDDICKHAQAMLREEMGWDDADVHFFPGATQANFILHAAALRPVESVIAASTGHIVNHEAGSVENTGHQILTAPFHDDNQGKLTADDVLSIVEPYHNGGAPEYLTEPKLVYISQPTEYGALYSLEELQAIKDVCEEYDMMLFVDGARMAYALGSEQNDVTLWDLAALCDAFTIGGTKCGALFGEAMVITNDLLKRRFRTYMKQNGAILAKGWLLGLQYVALFRNGTYYRLGEDACKKALRVRAAFEHAGVPMYNNSPTNQQFALLTQDQQDALKDTFNFESFGHDEATDRDIIRFCTSWSTEDLEVDALVSAIGRL